MATVYFEDLSIDQAASFSKTITETDITLFAGICGDMNPVHVNADYSASARFGQRIAHGVLTASLVSTVIGMRLPGEGSIYLAQSTRFCAPVFIGDTVTASVTVTALDPVKKRVTLKTQCHVGDKLVLEGESQVLALSRGGDHARRD